MHVAIANKLSINLNFSYVVIELIGGTDISYDLAKLSLENGKHFVTANKALIAEKGSELFELASKKNLHLGFEASVGGGIPIIRTINYKTSNLYS